MLTVILAGGGSRRMGRDKAMLPFRGETLLQYQINKYKVLGPVAVSVNAHDRFPFVNAVEIVDAFPGCGPLNGIIGGFSVADEDALFLTAVDLPYGEPKLAARLAALRGDADVCVICSSLDRSEPLFAVYSRKCAAVAVDCLSIGKKSVLDLFARVQVRYVLPDELPEFDLEKILLNVNTPDVYQCVIE